MDASLPPAITSRQNPLVARFRSAARGRRAAGDEVLLEGATLIDEARRADWPIEVLAIASDAAEAPEIAALRATADPARTVVVSRPVMEAISPVPAPSGAVALARPVIADVDAVFAHAPQLVVIAVDVQDPGNVGAVVRAAEAAGATGIALCGAAADPWSWKALRGAMGSAFRLPIARLDAPAALDRAARHGLALAAAIGRGGTPFDACDFTRPTAVIVGSEGQGLPAAIVERADVRISIPMAGSVESLNVAVATAVILYEARRQRGGRLRAET